VVSSAGHGRRRKRSQKKLRQVQRARRPAPRFGGLDHDHDHDPATVGVEGAGGYVTGVDPAVLADPTARHPTGGVARRRRLLSQGHDRHAILHALAYELSHELYPALTGQHAPTRT
jgi:hypothetical protein